MSNRFAGLRHEVRKSICAAMNTYKPPALNQQLDGLLDELRDLRNQRFRWITAAKNDFKEWVTRREEWDKKADGAIQDLKDVGWDEQAAQLSAALCSNRLVAHPGSFEIVYDTAYGLERITVFIEARESASLDDIIGKPATQRHTQSATQPPDPSRSSTDTTSSSASPEQNNAVASRAQNPWSCLQVYIPSSPQNGFHKAKLIR